MGVVHSVEKRRTWLIYCIRCDRFSVLSLSDFVCVCFSHLNFVSRMFCSRGTKADLVSCAAIYCCVFVTCARLLLSSCTYVHIAASVVLNIVIWLESHVTTKGLLVIMNILSLMCSRGYCGRLSRLCWTESMSSKISPNDADPWNKLLSLLNCGKC